jgi:CubicO group peptidase (beta-lactamase class C family)
MSAMTVNGTTTSRFAACRQAMAANLADGYDLGAAFAVVKDGELVADLYGGYADAARTRPWARDTVVNVWSTTKGVLALAVAMAVERGLLRYDAPIADVWPEFAAGGKENITLDLVMSHRSGLNGLDRAMDLDGLYAWTPFVEALAAMAPLWEPGSRCVYHALTYGHLAGEALRRADGRMPGRFIAEEIAGPLDMAFYVGLPESEDHRAAEITASDDASDWVGELVKNGYPQSMENPVVVAATPNDRAWRAADIPAGNGHSDAQSLARLYGLLAQGGGDLISADGLAAATAERYRGIDVSMGLPTAFGAGYRLGDPDGLLGPSLAAFGHTGWGGAFAFADPDNGLGVAFVMNRMLGMGDDALTRHARLIEAVYGSL